MYTKLYWLTRLDNINSFITSVGVICVFIVVAMGIWTAINSESYSFDSEEEKENRKKLKATTSKMAKILLPLGFFFLLFRVFVPTKDEAILIIAGGKVAEYVNKDTSLQKIPFQTTEYLKLVLDREIQDLKDKK